MFIEIKPNYNKTKQIFIKSTFLDQFKKYLVVHIVNSYLIAYINTVAFYVYVNNTNSIKDRKQF